MVPLQPQITVILDAISHTSSFAHRDRPAMGKGRPFSEV